MPSAAGVRRSVARLAATSFLLGALFGCSVSFPRLPASGEIAGTHIDTTVDSEFARDYLQNFGDEAKAAPFDRVCRAALTAATAREDLKRLSQDYSPDAATLCLARVLLDNPKNRALQRAFLADLDRLKASDRRAAALPVRRSYLILFAPGWLYRAYPHTGADFARQRQLLAQLGMQAALIETEENGTVERNALLIAGKLRELQATNKDIILVSASKSGAEVAHALGELAHPAHHVKAWINVGGIVKGTPLADAAMRFPKRWLARLVFMFSGRGIASIDSMRTDLSSARFARARIPDHILIINYLGLPLSGNFAEDGQEYLALRKYGPNDGRVLLADAIVPQGQTLLEPGRDHFFQDSEIDIKTAALAYTVIRYLEHGEKQEGQ